MGDVQQQHAEVAKVWREFYDSSGLTQRGQNDPALQDLLETTFKLAVSMRFLPSKPHWRLFTNIFGWLRESSRTTKHADAVHALLEAILPVASELPFQTSPGYMEEGVRNTESLVQFTQRMGLRSSTVDLIRNFYGRKLRGVSDVIASPQEGECSICLSDGYENGDNVAILPCGHLFHFDCMLRVVQMDALPRCPYCRTVLFSFEDSLEDEFEFYVKMFDEHPKEIRQRFLESIEEDPEFYEDLFKQHPEIHRRWMDDTDDPAILRRLRAAMIN